ncbi:hypothetical protein GCM10029976_009800 [Kribbella albertanoniae]
MVGREEPGAVTSYGLRVSYEGFFRIRPVPQPPPPHPYRALSPGTGHVGTAAVEEISSGHDGAAANAFSSDGQQILKTFFPQTFHETTHFVFCLGLLLRLGERVSPPSIS